MPVATVLASAVHQALDLALGEIASLDCQVYDGWYAFLRSRFHADKPCRRGNDCLAYTLFLNSQRPAVLFASNQLGRHSAWPISPTAMRKLSAQLRPQHWCGRCAPR